MHYLTGHWSFDPFLIVAIAAACWHEIGLARLARRSRPERTRQRRLRSLWFYAGLGVLLLAVQSPIDYWSDDYFFVHMVQHLLLMFAAPTLIVAGAPWQPLLDGLPGRTGRSATAEVLRGAWSPALLDLAENNQAVHIWLMHASFFLVGVLFWLQFIPSPPFRMRMPPASQAVAIVATNVIMWILAMSMSFLTQVSWYPVYNHIPGVTLPPFAD